VLGISALHSAALADLTLTVVQDIGSVLSSERSSAWAPAKPHPYDALIRALARAHRWKRMLENGTFQSAGGITEAEGVTRSFVNRLLRLTLLAPDILGGRQPKGMQLEELTRRTRRACSTATTGTSAEGPLRRRRRLRPIGTFIGGPANRPAV
jgi:hypothetical protein